MAPLTPRGMPEEAKTEWALRLADRAEATRQAREAVAKMGWPEYTVRHGLSEEQDDEEERATTLHEADHLVVENEEWDVEVHGPVPAGARTLIKKAVATGYEVFVHRTVVWRSRLPKRQEYMSESEHCGVRLARGDERVLVSWVRPAGRSWKTDGVLDWTPDESALVIPASRTLKEVKERM